MAAQADKNHEPTQLLLIGQQSQDESNFVGFERRIREVSCFLDSILVQFVD
jgi:hypothetical protein